MLEWKSISTVPKCHFISILKEKSYISKGSIYHLVQVNDFSVAISPFHCVIIVNKFRDYLTKFRPKREIDLDTDILQDSHPIYIFPYRMEPTELKELNISLRSPR